MWTVLASGGRPPQTPPRAIRSGQPVLPSGGRPPQTPPRATRTLYGRLPRTPALPWGEL
jgi:hypothetical protein